MPLSSGSFLRLLQRRTAFQSVVEDHVYRYLTQVTGAIDMNVDGSVAAINFDYIVPAGTIYNSFKLSRYNIVMLDSAMRWDRFGGLVALANGLLLQILDNEGTIQQHFDTDRVPVRDNADFGGLAGVDNNLTTIGAGPDAMPVRFSMFKSGNHPTLFPGWIVRAVVQDNLTGLDKLRIQLQGVLRRTRGPIIN